MADQKVSELNAVVTPDNADTLPTVNGGATKKITWIVVKAFLKTYFDTLYRAIDYINYAVDSVGTDAYAITITTPTIASYIAGQEFTFKAGTANTGACTLAVNGLAAITIKKNVTDDLATGDILANQIVIVKYDGTNMQLVSNSALTAVSTSAGAADVAKIPRLNASGVLDSSFISTNKKIYLSTTEVTFTAGNGGNGAGVEKSVFSTTITAGTLGTNNGIKFKCFISGADASASASAWIIKISLGTTILTLTDGGGGGNPLTGMSGFLEGYILADGATNAQKVSATLFLSANKNEDQGDTSVVVTKLYIGGTATAAKDSTGALTFEILATLANNAGNNGVFEWLVVETIS